MVYGISRVQQWKRSSSTNPSVYTHIRGVYVCMYILARTEHAAAVGRMPSFGWGLTRFGLYPGGESDRLGTSCPTTQAASVSLLSIYFTLAESIGEIVTFFSRLIKVVAPMCVQIYISRNVAYFG